MISLPANLSAAYNSFMVQQEIPISQQPYFHKWLRYYIDFYHKYRHGCGERSRLSAFLTKLNEKQQAQDAIAFFHEMSESWENPLPIKDAVPIDRIVNEAIAERNEFIAKKRWTLGRTGRGFTRSWKSRSRFASILKKRWKAIGKGKEDASTRTVAQLRIQVKEWSLSGDEIIEGASSGRLQAAFGADTAAMVSPVGPFIFRDHR